MTRNHDQDIDSDGVSPTEIFGIDKETIRTILKGLAVSYPEYISVSFTHDLDNITLVESKSSKEILQLLK